MCLFEIYEFMLMHLIYTEYMPFHSLRNDDSERNFSYTDGSSLVVLLMISDCISNCTDLEI